jgi:tetratricopeptide (TPR) repeat protein
VKRTSAGLERTPWHQASGRTVCAFLLLIVGILLSGCGPESAVASPTPADSAAGNAGSNQGKPEAEDSQAAPKEAAYPYQVNAELARVYLKYNIVDEALRLFDLAITQQLQQTGSEDAENWTGLGDALVRAKRTDEAAKAYGRAAQIYRQLLPQAKNNQLHNFYLHKLAVLSQALGQNEERLNYLAQLRADQNSAAQQLELAGILEQVGQKEKAEECLKRALALTTDDAQAHATAQIAYAGMLSRTDRLDEALEQAKAAHVTEGLDAETSKTARRLLFEIYEARGDADKLEFK